ncbi:hypothetical protein H072_11460 [Dactylellina haptotyla CBS 200.50]|uniref:Yeast cell wall synthesis Kre9/Knh1-like N-terminal domain-containing protein n=1 Tax=Dactylellina haptotyla (strain CBS 200.50) TaxID=1284197 RepID=S8BIS1_DACHA|nr:hypothetical protein H072_11460 [Dactylellina haptotyla CBS 200.50]
MQRLITSMGFQLFTFLALVIPNALGVDARILSHGNVVTSPAVDEVVLTGQLFTIKWATLIGPQVNLTLLDKPDGQIEAASVIASDIDNTGKYQWDIPTKLRSSSSSYVIRIAYGSDPNNHSYSGRFNFQYPISAVNVATIPVPADPPPRASSFSTSSSLTSNRPALTSDASRTNSSPASASSTGPAGSDTGANGLIIGVGIGGIALLIVGGLVVLWIVVRKRRKQVAKVPSTLSPRSRIIGPSGKERSLARTTPTKRPRMSFRDRRYRWEGRKVAQQHNP